MEIENLDSFTIEEVKKIITDNYPDWIILTLKGYSKDYPHLQKNWKTLCSQLKTEPREIILVNEIVFGDTPTILNKICDLMTKNGYVIRRANEFIACRQCEMAIPCKKIWMLLKEKGFKVPENWTDKCTSCV